MDSITTVQRTLNSAISEYFIKYGYFKALDALSDDVTSSSQKSKLHAEPKPKATSSINEKNAVNLILRAFDRGQREQFFILWNRYIPLNMRQKDLVCYKLIFYCHIYFAVFPLHPNNSRGPNEKDLRREMKEFKNYLETKGADLSKTSEFLPFYALPYINNPLAHPQFKHLFQK